MDIPVKDDKYRKYSALAFIVVIIVVGVPMWWKTTEVYRVRLPYTEIQNLNNTPITVSSNIYIYIRNRDRESLIINELIQNYNTHNFLKVNFIPITIEENDWNSIKTPAILEAHILKKYKVNFGEFIFIEWSKLEEDVLVTSDRTAFISSQTSATKIISVLRYWIFEEHKLKDILKDPSIREINSITNNNLQLNYDILISVLNPRPDLQNIHWNVRNAVEAYLEPFFNSISLLHNFTLKSQWKYQLEFKNTYTQVKKDHTNLGRHYALPEENLPQIITSIERKLGSEVTRNQCIHLVVYLPSCNDGPIHLYNKNGLRTSKHKVDSFLSPNWGGIIIENPREDICLKFIETQEPIDFHINSKDVMQISLYLLRKIFNIQNDITIPGASMIPIENLTPRLWEIDTYTRTRLVHLINTATLTLQSLIKLLDDISYIVINDDVGEAINTAYTNIIIAKEYLEKGDLEKAVIYAKIAFAKSEKAFFDPSMLALLYFPDEQKYAIYIPLFLPIMIPVLLSITSLKKSFSSQNKKENKDDDEKDQNLNKDDDKIQGIEDLTKEDDDDDNKSIRKRLKK